MNARREPERSWDDIEADGLLDGLRWEYVAAEDACPVGRSLHGRTFATLAAVYEHLPGFNENPACTRTPCGCTALPLAADQGDEPGDRGRQDADDHTDRDERAWILDPKRVADQ